MIHTYSRTRDRQPCVDTFLAETLTTAVEGGIGHWAAVDFYAWNFDGEAIGSLPLTPSGGDNAYAHLEILPEYVDPASDLGDVHELTLDTVELGLRRAVESGDPVGRRLAIALDPQVSRTDVRDLDVDADDADRIVQFALFGRPVFA